MSTLLQRFRANDVSKFTSNFGDAGTYTNGSTPFGITAIFHDPAKASEFMGAAIEDVAPYLIVSNNDIAAPAVNDTWQANGSSLVYTIVSVAPGSRSGTSKLTITLTP